MKIKSLLIIGVLLIITGCGSKGVDPETYYNEMKAFVENDKVTSEELHNYFGELSEIIKANKEEAPAIYAELSDLDIAKNSVEILDGRRELSFSEGIFITPEDNSELKGIDTALSDLRTDLSIQYTTEYTDTGYSNITVEGFGGFTIQNNFGSEVKKVEKELMKTITDFDTRYDAYRYLDVYRVKITTEYNENINIGYKVVSIKYSVRTADSEWNTEEEYENDLLYFVSVNTHAKNVEKEVYDDLSSYLENANIRVMDTID